MTELRYGPTSPAPGTWRTIVVALATLGGPLAALVAGFVALITWSGCFLGCSSAPDHTGGGLLGVLAVLLLVSGPVLAGLLLKRASAVGWSVLGVVGVLAATVLKLGVL